MTNLIIVPETQRYPTNDTNGEVRFSGPLFIINPNNEKSVDLMLSSSTDGDKFDVHLNAGKEIGDEISIRFISRPDHTPWSNNLSRLNIVSLPPSGEINVLYDYNIENMGSGVTPFLGFIYNTVPAEGGTKIRDSVFRFYPLNSLFLNEFGSAFVTFKWTGTCWLSIAENYPDLIV